MIEDKAHTGPDVSALRDAIERFDPDLLLGFYADDAELRVVNADSAGGPTFELRGKAEIGKYLRVVSSQRTSSRTGAEVVGEDLIAFREVCEYPDGTQVVVKTTLVLREGKVSSHVDSVEHESRTTSQGRKGV